MCESPLELCPAGALGSEICGLLEPKAPGTGDAGTSLEAVASREAVASVGTRSTTVIPSGGVSSTLNMNSPRLAGIGTSVPMDIPLRCGVVPSLHFDVGTSFLGCGRQCSHNRDGKGSDNLFELHFNLRKEIGQDAIRHLCSQYSRREID